MAWLPISHLLFRRGRYRRIQLHDPAEEYLFQSPISYDTQAKSWDRTPGYETELHPEFTHQRGAIRRQRRQYYESHAQANIRCSDQLRPSFRFSASRNLIIV
jgi:hypothetical protein